MRRRKQAGSEPTEQPAAPDLDEVQALVAKADAAVRHAAEHYLGRKPMLRPDTQHLDVCRELLSFASPEHVTHEQLRRVERSGLSLLKGASFRRNMIEQSEARKLGVMRPAWLLDNKARAYEFVDAVGIRRPRSFGGVRMLGEIQPTPGTIVKPVRATGSRGVYAIEEPDRIRHLRDGRAFGSWAEVMRHAGRLMSQKKARPMPDRWMVEELVLEDDGRLAGDLKYYTFFGEVLFVQESRREAGLEVCFWSRDGQRISTGRYEDQVLADALGSTEAQFELVSTFSRRIPVPFMRIDMLRSRDGLVFGEFTPRPGHFDEFTDELDRTMGEAWLRAEANITEQMLLGDTFSEFAAIANKRSR